MFKERVYFGYLTDLLWKFEILNLEGGGGIGDEQCFFCVGTMQRTATHCNALQDTVTHGNTLQCTATRVRVCVCVCVCTRVHVCTYVCRCSVRCTLLGYVFNICVRIYESMYMYIQIYSYSNMRIPI